MALATRVNLHRAVSIQPLTSEQIERYLQSAGDQLDVLQHALHHDPELYEMAHRPLMLSIFTLAYQGAGPEELSTDGTREAQQRQVFATYVERMLARRGASRLFSREQTLRWLTFLAKRMQQQNQTVFYVEYLQPDWFPGTPRLLYQGCFELIGGYVGRLVIGLGVGLVLGLVLGLGVGLAGALVLLTNWQISAIGSLIRVEVDELVGRLDARIEPAEVLTWSWKKARTGLVLGLASGLGVGLIFGLGAGLNSMLSSGLVIGLNSMLSSGLVIGLTSMLVYGLAGTLLGALLGGLSRKQLPEPERLSLTPNGGIWRSGKNGLVFGLIIGAVTGLGAGLGAGLIYGLISGLISALGVGLIFGLDAFFQHFALRFWLWRAGSLPWNLVAFLDEAAERILLRKVGAGYIFIHRLLLDYFADLEKKGS